MNKKAADYFTKLASWLLLMLPIAFGMFFILQWMIVQEVEYIVSTPRDMNPFIYSQRLIGSADCFAYEDNLGYTNPVTIDFNKFSERSTWETCYNIKNKEYYAFKLVLYNYIIQEDANNPYQLNKLIETNSSNFESKKFYSLFDEKDVFIFKDNKFEIGVIEIYVQNR